MDPAQLERVGGAADFRHPAELLEPEEESRAHEDRVRLLQILAGAMTWIHRAERPIVGVWQVTYALGLNQADKPMIEVAADLGIERATLSGGARKFLGLFDPPLPPSQAMRSEAACGTYNQRRIANLDKHNDNRTTDNRVQPGRKVAGRGNQDHARCRQRAC